MTVEEMRRIKKERSLTNAMIAEMAELPLRTVQKVFSGETKHPRFDTLSALENVFRTLDPRVLKEDVLFSWHQMEKHETQKSYYDNPPADVQVVTESRQNYGTSTLRSPGPFTVDDYHRLPDGERAELIDGQLLYMEFPSRIHQLIAGEVYRQIGNYIYDNDINYMPGVSQMCVQLDCDDKTMVQPDVLVVCDPEKAKGRDVFGAPDFVLEVLSPTTAKKDIFTKSEKYRLAGVREYWILDPLAGTLDVRLYGFPEEDVIYDMTEPVALRIFEGKLRIDFKRILAWIEDNRRIES